VVLFVPPFSHELYGIRKNAFDPRSEAGQQVPTTSYRCPLWRYGSVTSARFPIARPIPQCPNFSYPLISCDPFSVSPKIRLFYSHHYCLSFRPTFYRSKIYLIRGGAIFILTPQVIITGLLVQLQAFDTSLTTSWLFHQLACYFQVARNIERHPIHQTTLASYLFIKK
jgi:hypothetical protein